MASLSMTINKIAAEVLFETTFNKQKMKPFCDEFEPLCVETGFESRIKSLLFFIVENILVKNRRIVGGKQYFASIFN